MTKRIPIVGMYLLALAGVGLLTLKVSSLLAVQAIALSQPYFLDNCPCLPPLVEQRRLAAFDAPAQVADHAKSRVAALEAPVIPVGLLAAQMDVAEGRDLALAVMSSK
jgi:hypothetical protein